MSSATATAEVEADHGHPETNSGISNNKLAMWLFLASDCLLFGALISTFLLYRTNISDNTPFSSAVDDVFDIPFTSLSSFVLLMSSLTMVLALSAVNRDDERSGRIWLLTTAFLGMIFIGGQVYEFTVFATEYDLGYSTNTWTSAFYTLTGFHGVHVSVGILLLLGTVFGTRKSGLGKEKAENVELVGLYWHFVDIVWVIIFTIVYLIPIG
ncbi:MAG: heme-copper oxidase subunit III [Acidimicrobiales bacterium]|nr:heme-copper oxidase subunit III [Acidimicrobiales bacterium]RZV44938.1 MAG: heme-copper oxidase subunit III [Acidimicrobiales bacterium]